MEKIAYLGPQGSYSFLAAQALKPNAEKLPFASFYLVMDALTSFTADFAVFPIENSLNGGIAQNMDLLEATDGVFAYDCCSVYIDHRLATLKGADLSKIRRIYSHEQPLAQCAKYLKTNFPYAELLPAPSTTAGIAMVKSKEDACIIGAQNSPEGFTMSEENIADEKVNFTRFLLVGRGSAPIKKSSKIYFCVTLPHAAGSLLSFLKVISSFGLNMVKIESRPVKAKPGEYRFFIEIEADYSQKAVRDALKAFEEAANSFKLLGCY